MRSEQINELSTAMAKAQGEIENAVFNRINPHFKNRYADLAAVLDAIRKPLSKHGLWVSQTIKQDDVSGAVTLVTTLFHSSGQWLSSHHPLPAGAKPQEFGSALTYAKRYSLSAIVGIAADEDDDANEAQKAQPVVVKPAEPLDPGKAREIPLGASPDWVWFGKLMIECSKREDWPEWDETNRLNLARMENEAPKVHARMMAAINKAAPSA